MPPLQAGRREARPAGFSRHGIVIRALADDGRPTECTRTHA